MRRDHKVLDLEWNKENDHVQAFVSPRDGALHHDGMQ